MSAGPAEQSTLHDCGMSTHCDILGEGVYGTSIPMTLLLRCLHQLVTADPATSLTQECKGHYLRGLGFRSIPYCLSFSANHIKF